MPTSCCVIGCKSRGNGQAGVQFFQLPLNKPKILTQWLIVLDRRDWIPKPSSRICSLHFYTDDYVTRPNTNVPRLKPDAIPSVFPDLSSSQDEKETSPLKPKEENSPIKPKEEMSPVNEKEETNDGIEENRIKPKGIVSKISTPVMSESPSGRPRRVSKLNSKMKDYILLDDIKKHRQNTPQSALSKPQPPSDKEKAAQELLSILEDSSSLSGDEASVKLSSSKVSSVVTNQKASSLSKLAAPNDKAKETSLKSTLTMTSSSPPKVASSKDSSSEILSKFTVSIRDHLTAGNTCPKQMADGVAPVSRKVASKSTGGKLPLRRMKDKGTEIVKTIAVFRDGKVYCSQESPNSIPTKSEKNKSVLSKPKSTDKSESNASKKVVPKGFRKVYYHTQVGGGDKSYYFSYADLNPFVDLTRDNPLYKDDECSSKDNAPSDNEVTDDENDNADLEDNVPDGEPTHIIDSDDNTDVTPVKKPSIVEASPKRVKRPYKKRQQTKKGQKELGNIKFSSKKELKKGTPKKHLKHINDNSSVNDSAYDEADPDDSAADEAVVNDTPFEELHDNSPSKIIAEKGITSPTMSKVSKHFKVTSPVKRKKRLKTIAEIVVRTDNSGQVPSVSIDKINNLVDIENETPPRKRMKRLKQNYITTGAPDIKAMSETIMTKMSEETELDRLSQRITETIKKMKLLEKVKGNTSKLTVLITTLPPVQEKEILIIKKKNLETNIEQSRELQVAISNYKTSDVNLNGSGCTLSPNSNAALPPFAHLDVPILGACNNDTIIEESVTCSVNDESSQSQKCIPQKEAATIEGSSAPNQTEEGSAPYDEVSPLTDEVSLQDATGQTTKNPATNATEDESNTETNISDTVGESTGNSASQTNELDKGIQIEPTVPLQHDHTYMTVINPTVVMTEGENSTPDQTKDVFSKLKLSDVEISFRTKVSQKIRNLKENVKRKNETIHKLKEKLRFMERTMKDERRAKIKQVKPRKTIIETNTLYDNIIDNNELTKSIDYNLDNTDLPMVFEENLESEEERACSSPITYLCEPAIDVCEKPSGDE